MTAPTGHPFSASPSLRPPRVQLFSLARYGDRVPMFLDQRGLRALADWMIEAVRNPIIHRLDQIMGLVSIDDTILQGFATSIGSVDTSLQTIATQVAALVTAGTLAPDDAAVQSIQSSLTDAATQITAITTSLTPPVTAPVTDPSAPVDPTSGTTAAPTS